MRGLLRVSAALACAVAIFGIGSAGASDFHATVFLKGCASPVPVGGQLLCTYKISNTLDSTHDTIRVTALSDAVDGSIPVALGNVLPALQLVLSRGASCSGGGGSGTTA